MIKALIAATLSAAAFMAPAGAAQAGWVKAETDRFIIYGDVPEATARDYAVKLSTFDKVLHTYVPEASDAPPARKFEVFLLRQGGLDRIIPGSSSFAGGFYRTTSQAEYAAVSITADGLSGDTVLFHEYAHHFMFANFPAAYPGWFVEGWAEYFGNTQITPAQIKVGAYNKDRVWWLGSDWIRWDDLFDKSMGDINSWGGALYYPQSWLFIHYMLSTKERSEQLNQITAAIAAGEAPSKAVYRITGLNISQLNRQLHAYRELRLLVIANTVAAPPVTVTALPPSADLLLDRLRLTGVNVRKPDRSGFLADVRRRAAKYPGDALADQVLAQAEFTYGDVAAGEAIVARRLAAAPDEVDSLRIAGLGQLLAGERDPKTRQARYRAARLFLIKAYGLDPTDFRTLYAYALSRTIEPGFPNDNDLKALEEAHGLAPSASDITLLTGDALIRRGQQAPAQRMLAILANNPHGGRATARAKALLAGGPPLKLEELTLADDDGREEPKKPPKKPPSKTEPPPQPKTEAPPPSNPEPAPAG